MTTVATRPDVFAAVDAAVSLARLGVAAGMPAPHTITNSARGGGCLIFGAFAEVEAWATWAGVKAGMTTTTTHEFVNATVEHDGVTVRLTTNRAVRTHP